MSAGHNVHFVGSLPAEDTASALEALSNSLGGVLKRVPDGETGARSKFVTWQAPVFGTSEQFEVGELGPQSEWGPNGEFPPRVIGLKPGATGRPTFAPTGYGEAVFAFLGYKPRFFFIGLCNNRSRRRYGEAFDQSFEVLDGGGQQELVFGPG